MNFQTVNGKLIDIINYSKEILENNPDVEIYVGTDSQNKKRKTNYVTAVCYRFKQSGVHYVYFKEGTRKIKDLWSRLYNETERTIQVAEFLKKHFPNVSIIIDLDFNDDEQHPSQALISASKGWANSLGYHVNTKSDIQIATRAADHHCRN